MHRAIKWPPAGKIRTAALAALGIAAALTALWAGSGWFRPLGDLLPLTRQMVGTTREILAETETLGGRVERVAASMSQLERQERLLEEQAGIAVQVLAELRQQEQLSAEARGLLGNILKTERITVDLTRESDKSASVTLKSVTENGRELDRLSAAALRIETGSGKMDGQLSRLLVEMDGAAENFKVVERVRTATGVAVDRAKNWWKSVLEWFKWGK